MRPRLSLTTRSPARREWREGWSIYRSHPAPGSLYGRRAAGVRPAGIAAGARVPRLGVRRSADLAADEGAAARARQNGHVDVTVSRWPHSELHGSDDYFSASRLRFPIASSASLDENRIVSRDRSWNYGKDITDCSDDRRACVVPIYTTRGSAAELESKSGDIKRNGQLIPPIKPSWWERLLARHPRA